MLRQFSELIATFVACVCFNWGEKRNPQQTSAENAADSDSNDPSDGEGGDSQRRPRRGLVWGPGQHSRGRRFDSSLPGSI